MGVDKAKIAFMTGELIYASGKISSRKGFPVFSLKTIRCDSTLQKCSINVLRFFLSVNSMKAGALNSTSGNMASGY